MRSLRDLLARLSPEEVKQVDVYLKELKRRLPLTALREECNVTQKQLASSMGVTQAAISRIESRNDMLLSSFVAFVHALGGETKLRVNLPFAKYVIDTFEDTTSSDGKKWLFELRKTERQAYPPLSWQSFGTVVADEVNQIASAGSLLYVRRQFARHSPGTLAVIQ